MKFWIRRLQQWRIWGGLLIGLVVTSIAAGTIVIQYAYLADGVNVHITPYTQWISVSPSGYQLTFFLLIPILSALSTAQLFQQDKTSGLLAQILTRMDLWRYNLVLQTWAIVGGAVTVGLPLLINFWILWTWFPTLIPNLMINRNMPVIESETYFASWYYSTPFKLVLLHIGLAMLIGGLYSLFSLAVSCYTTQAFIPVVSGFLVTLLLSVAGSIMAMTFAPVLIVMVSSPNQIPNLITFLIMIGLAYLACSLATTIGVRRYAIK